MGRKRPAIGELEKVAAITASAITVLAATFTPRVALGYVLPAEVILANSAKRRADIAFTTIVAEGTWQREGGPPMDVYEVIKEGRAHRVEKKGAAGTEVELTVGAKRWTFKLGDRPAQPAKSAGDLLLTFLGTAEKEGGSQRGIQFLEQRGVDTNVVSLSRFDRRVVYVIGAKPWDLSKPQLWIDKNLLVPVRMIEVDKATGAVTDTRLYGIGSAITGEWFPQRVELWRDGKLVEATSYRSARLNEEVNEDLFRAPT